MAVLDAGQHPGLPLVVTDLDLRGIDGRPLVSLPRLNVTAGSSLAIRGPSGAGKSTLLHAFSGLVTPAGGRVVWGGTDIAGLSDSARTRFRRQNVGLIFQDFLLFEELGALDNASLSAAFAPRAERAALRDRAASWLNRFGLGQAGTRRADSFSGGERQRVAVARALSNDPAVILADEPTASLDRATADRLIDDLVALSQDSGRTLIVVTHDATLATRLDRVVTMADGRIVEDSDE
ncbi:ABC transporter ATP-binding protein [Loktanella sp. SALINAS62]|uniref:ABC transporter ATP-binding protein n=1 Tax=Loktanella sp. SALINAS62 TaxID=2706124 RepID=UPI001B8C4955|nr:ABC transporter ATP-binding protein [Loktanella sp. SALINAS62]MBS1302014.1 ABC transporter ATP-binding protein [Loktanella sp. SALINAS62]